nr:MAG TPA: hypothetical protein [Caudoviricetes sp.]
MERLWIFCGPAAHSVRLGGLCRQIFIAAKPCTPRPRPAWSPEWAPPGPGH